MRSKIKIKILTCLASGPIKAIDLFSIFLNPYENPIKRMEYNDRDINSINKWQEDREEKKKFSRLVYLMKREGIIESTGRRGVSGVLNITKRGKSLVKSSGRSYLDQKPEEDNCYKIIAFDIPEKERKKRKWLRGTLACLGFTMIQQSVWFGRSKIPKEFTEDLVSKEIFNKVEILTIDKLGSLNKLNIRK